MLRTRIITGGALVGFVLLAGAARMARPAPALSVESVFSGAEGVDRELRCSVSHPSGSPRGLTGPCGSRTPGNNSIGRITPGGQVHALRHAGIDAPGGITAGPDGALWFTNCGNDSIGRITTAGTVTNYTGTGISNPHGITAGPDGALWFTNGGNDSIGRITTDGHGHATYRHASIGGPVRDRGRARRRPVVHQQRQRLDRADHHRRRRSRNYRGPRASATRGGSGRAGRRPLVHQQRQRLDRADHHRRHGHQLPAPSISGPQGITAGPDGALWFTNAATTRSGGSRPRGTVTNYPAPASASPRGSRPGPTAPCGSPTSGNDSIGRITTGGDGHATTATASISNPIGDRRRARRRPVVHQRAATTRSGGSPPAATVTNYTGTEHPRPVGIAAGPDGALWFTQQRSTTRSGGSPPAGRSPPTGTRHPRPLGIAAGPDGALWFTNSGGDSIGRITTAGEVTNYTGPASAARRGSRRGRTAPCGSPTATTTRSGGSPPTGKVTQLHATRASATRGGSRPGPTAPCGSPTIEATRSGGSRPPARSPTTRHSSIRGPWGITRRARRRPLVHQHRQATRSGGSPPTARSAATATRHRQAVGDRRRAGRRPLVHQRRQRLDRASTSSPGVTHSVDGPRHKRSGVIVGTMSRPVLRAVLAGVGSLLILGLVLAGDVQANAATISKAGGRHSVPPPVSHRRVDVLAILCKLRPGQHFLPAGAVHGLANHLRQYPDLSLATSAERARAERILDTARQASSRFRDAGAAKRAGFDIHLAKRPPPIVGILHAESHRYSEDGAFFDPRRPEALIYANQPGRPLVLIGVMFSMPRGKPGPAVIGPIGRWHSHLVCVRGLRRGLARVNGACPRSTRLAQGSEMLHIWFTRDLRSAYAVHAPLPELCRDGLLSGSTCRSGIGSTGM